MPTAIFTLLSTVLWLIEAIVGPKPAQATRSLLKFLDTFYNGHGHTPLATLKADVSTNGGFFWYLIHRTANLFNRNVGARTSPKPLALPVRYICLPVGETRLAVTKRRQSLRKSHNTLLVASPPTPGPLTAGLWAPPPTPSSHLTTTTSCPRETSQLLKTCPTLDTRPRTKYVDPLDAASDQVIYIAKPKPALHHVFPRPRCPRLATPAFTWKPVLSRVQPKCVFGTIARPIDTPTILPPKHPNSINVEAPLQTSSAEDRHLIVSAPKTEGPFDGLTSKDTSCAPLNFKACAPLDLDDPVSDALLAPETPSRSSLRKLQFQNPINYSVLVSELLSDASTTLTSNAPSLFSNGARDIFYTSTPAGSRRKRSTTHPLLNAAARIPPATIHGLNPRAPAFVPQKAVLLKPMQALNQAFVPIQSRTTRPFDVSLPMQYVPATQDVRSQQRRSSQPSLAGRPLAALPPSAPQRTTRGSQGANACQMPYPILQPQYSQARMRHYQPSNFVSQAPIVGIPIPLYETCPRS